jgi:hypothetical protein
MRYSVSNGVADPGCLSRILIFIHPGFRIPELGSRISKNRKAKERGEKKFVVTSFFLATNITKLKTILLFELVKKII